MTTLGRFQFWLQEHSGRTSKHKGRIWAGIVWAKYDDIKGLSWPLTPKQAARSIVVTDELIEKALQEGS